MPLYYRSISTLELASNPTWLKRNQSIIDQAIIDLLEIKKMEQGQQIFVAHINELSSLKSDLDIWLNDLKLQGNEKEYSRYRDSFSKLFSGLNLNRIFEIESNPISKINNPALANRFELVKFAQRQLGVPYLSAGDNPIGFDCSGFTCYVMSSSGQKIPRRAKDQYDESIKVKESEAKMGDLAFFSNGGDISHVGMLINEPGKPKIMIHASSSRGISIIEIESSDYWKQRLVGFGTFLEK
jgi:hypothetical protein